ncbi:MAG: DEAD/DEAH box helicase family protein [Myxococcales bacterium]|nr:DEAD/DEAH box helicase family protein [Myxococcales bacterium]
MRVKLLNRAEERQVQVHILDRFPIYEGQRVTVASSSDKLIIRAVEGTGSESLRYCVVSNGDEIQTLPESIISPRSPSANHPVTFFENLQWDRPHDFYARLNLTLMRTQWYEASEGLPTFRGARIRPLAHQLYAARRILEDRSPRFILADEVGLGKTIEAGLVIQALLSADPELRVLVVAPGSMSRQWLRELYLRFGGRAFVHVPGGDTTEISTRERNRRANAALLIVSTTAMVEDVSFRDALTERTWDLVILDEAHQFPPEHELYQTMRRLSVNSEGFLALSATPSKRQLSGLSGLLALVAPGSYEPDDGKSLAEKLEQRREIWGVLASTVDILGAARAESEDDEPDRESIEFIIGDWKDVLPGEPEIARMLERADDGEVVALDELVAYIQEHYRIDHRIIRTRRRTLDILGTNFNRREIEYLDYEASAPEILLEDHLDALHAGETPTLAQVFLRTLYWRRFCSTPRYFLDFINVRIDTLREGMGNGGLAYARALQSSPGPAEQERLEYEIAAHAPEMPRERAWLEQARGLAIEWLEASSEGCARHRQVASWLEDFRAEVTGGKVLVFAEDRASVDEFTELMGAKFPSEVEAFHHGIDDDRLEAAALRFQNDRRCWLLVSDELGGEGRNFQIAECLVHLDTPLSVGRVEQRIGRLDRIGRVSQRRVKSVVVRGPSRVERALQSIHDSVFHVFTRSVGGLEFMLPPCQTRLQEAIGRGADLNELAQQMHTEVESTLSDVDEDFELSLDLSKQQLEQARELAELFAESAAQDEERDVRHWLGTLGVHARRDRGKLSFKWTVDSLNGETLPSLGEQGSTPYGTFDRTIALRNESLQYFAPGHKLIDSALAALRSSRVGRATLLYRDLGHQRRNQSFVVVVGTSRLAEHGWEDGIPAGLRTKAYNVLWPATDSVCVRIGIDDEPELVENHQLKGELLRIFRKHDGDREGTAP